MYSRFNLFCPMVRGVTPCPELLTEEEAIRYLRLYEINIEDPANTLRYYRKKGLLRATQVGKSFATDGLS